MEFSDKPVSGAQVWRGPDLARRDDWIHPFPADVLDDLDAAVRDARAKGATQHDFDCQAVEFDSFYHWLDPVCDDLAQGCGFALLRGFPLERYSVEEAKIALLVVGRHMGLIGRQAEDHSGISEVMDVQPPSRNTYYFHVGGPLPMHMDPVDVVGLLCVRKAAQGGESRIVSSMAVHNEILRSRPDLLEVLYRGFRNRKREHRRHDGKALTDHYCPVFADIGGDTICSYLPAPILMAVDDGLMTLTAEEKEALAFLDETAARSDLVLEMDIEPGDIQFLNNRHILHGRSDYRDETAMDRRRLLLRIWLTMPGWLKYPPTIPHADVELDTHPG